MGTSVAAANIQRIRRERLPVTKAHSTGNTPQTGHGCVIGLSQSEVEARSNPSGGRGSVPQGRRRHHRQQRRSPEAIASHSAPAPGGGSGAQLRLPVRNSVRAVLRPVLSSPIPELPEHQRRDLAQVMPPDHPLVAALGDAERVLDVVLGQSLVERLAAVQREVVLADADPEQLELLVDEIGVLEEVGDRSVRGSGRRRRS